MPEHSDSKSIKRKPTISLFAKTLIAIIIAFVLTFFCVIKLMQPILLEEGFLAHVNIELLQEMLNTTLNGKNSEEIIEFLKSRQDDFLNEAQIASKEELLSPNAPQKYGLWLHDDERFLLQNEIPFWTGKPKLGLMYPEDNPLPQLGRVFPPHNADFNHFHPAPFNDHNFPSRMHPNTPQDSNHINALANTSIDAGKFIPPPHKRISYGVIPITGTSFVIFSRRPMPLPPEYSIGTIIINTLFIIIILLLTAFILIFPLIRRIKSIEDTCQKVAIGNYQARCSDKRDDSIGVLAQHIDDMTASIERHLGQQKSLLQAVSHELRTPLSRIRFSIEMLDIPENDEKSMAKLVSIDDDLTEIDDLIKELGYFNYVDAGKGRQHFETSAIQDLIEMTLQKRSLCLDKLNITTSGIDKDMTIEADPTAFKRVIGNLLSNASRYAKSTIQISVSYTEDKKYIEICIDDDGPGIPEDKRSSIFEPFFCLEKSRSKSMSGHGLGLAIADRIIKVHGGVIEARDSELGGIRMYTKWPVIQNEPL